MQPSNSADADAYEILKDAILDARKRDAAKTHPVVGPIVGKLSDDDFETLRQIAENQGSTVCPPPRPDN